MSKRLLFLTGAVLLVIAVMNFLPTSVQAQCGTGPPGSCVECHIEQALVYEQGIWHGTHARKDCCTNCHGGNCSAAEKELAHVGIIANPLEDVYTNCHACHPDDYWQRAETFAVELNITPSSRATPTFVPTSDPASRQPTIFILPEQALPRFQLTRKPCFLYRLPWQPLSECLCSVFLSVEQKPNEIREFKF